MNTTNGRELTARTDRELREIKAACADALERGEPLVDWLDRFPELALELTDLAIALEFETIEAAPRREDVRFAVDALRRGLAQASDKPPSPASPGLVARAAAFGLAVPQLAGQLRLATDILFQIDRGYIRPESLPRRLLGDLAEVLRVPLATLPGELVGSTTPSAFYYADSKPAPGGQLSFAEALMDSEELAGEDRDRWLAVAREEGLA